MRKCVLITGASQGLGLSLLRQYTARDVDITAVDRQVNETVQSEYPQILFKSLDIADRESVRRLVESLDKAGKLPDIAIFNAAVHAVDNDPFIDFEKFAEVIDTNAMSTFNFLSCLMPILDKPATFVFCSSGVIIFPNPACLGYYLSKLAVTKAFDRFAERYSRYGFRFKSVILGPLHSPMLSSSSPPKGAVKFLRNITSGGIDNAASKIVKFIETPRRRMYYPRSSATVLWLARMVQGILPKALKFYQVPRRG